MKILAIDTSCDETSVAISNKQTILSNIVSSQVSTHKKWGGVVPILAKRKHIDNIDKTIELALQRANLTCKDINIFAVTYGPGLSIALEVGIAKAKELASKFDKPIIGVNHMAAHVYANFALTKNSSPYSIPLEQQEDIFPSIALLISGGHTEFVYMRDHLSFEKLGETLDDSIGEAFDKTATILHLGYPGGPIIETLSKNGDPTEFTLPIALKNTPSIKLSYSGLKTATIQLVEQIGIKQKSMFERYKDAPLSTNPQDLYSPSLSKKPTYKLKKSQLCNIAASFQTAATKQLELNLEKSLKQTNSKNILLGGGVVNNLYIRKQLRKVAKKYNAQIWYPKNKNLRTDNAAMVAVCAYFMYKYNLYSKIDKLDRIPTDSIENSTKHFI